MAPRARRLAAYGAAGALGAAGVAYGISRAYARRRRPTPASDPDLAVPDDVTETRLPSPEELELMRVLDPGAQRDREVRS